jgi:general stress protein YciG
MSGTKIGGQRAAKTNKRVHGKDFYAQIGKKGGLISTPTGGFGHPKAGADGLTGPERAKIAGAKGGRNSSRAGVKNGQGKSHGKSKAKKKGLFKRLFGGK